MKKALLLIAVTYLPFILCSQDYSAKQEWQTGMYGYNIGSGGMIAEDLDKDGMKELICTALESDEGWFAKSFYYILKFNPKTRHYDFLWISKVYSSRITSSGLFDYDQDGRKELLLGFDNNVIEVVDPISYKSIAVVKVGLSPVQIAFGNADNDNTSEIIISSSDSTFLFDKNFKRKFKIGYGGKFAISNVDADASKEIVYSSGKIVEVASNTTRMEYQFSDKEITFGVADLNNDNIDDIVFGDYEMLVAYDVVRKQKIWWKVVDGDVNLVTLFDFNGDDIKDVLWGNRYDEAVVENGATGMRDSNIKGWEIDNSQSIIIDNLDDISGPEVLLITGFNCSCADFINIFNVASKEKLWSNIHLDGPFAVAFGDFEGDGVMELAIASREGNSGYGAGYLTIYDANTHQMKARTTPNFFRSSYNGISHISFGDVDNDQKDELLVGVDYGYTYTLVNAYDASFNLKKTYTLEGMDLSSGIKVADLDNDKRNEVVITIGTNVFGSTEPEEYENYIYIFDSESGSQKWRSPKIGGIRSMSHNLIIGDVDDDEALEILAINSRPQFNIDDLILIDGKTFEMITEKSRNYTSLDLASIENSSKKEIVAGTKTGEIVILSENDLKDKDKFSVSNGAVIGLRVCDFFKSGKNQFAFSDGYTINFYDPERMRITWESDTLSNLVAGLNTMYAGNFDDDTAVELFVNVNHAVLQLEVLDGYDSPITGIEENVNKFPFNIYPNPADNSVWVAFNDDYIGKVEVLLLSIEGKVLNQFKVDKNNRIFNKKIDIDSLPVGYYLLNVTFQNRSITKKILKR